MGAMAAMVHASGQIRNYQVVGSIVKILSLPAAYLLAQTGNLTNVWWSFPIAEIMSAATTIFYFIRINNI